MWEIVLMIMFAFLLLMTVFFVAYFLGMSEALDQVEYYSINEVCPHWITETRTINVECGCETTAEFCTVCGEQISEIKTEC